MAYVKRFRDVLEQISSITDKEVMTCFERGLAPNSLKTDLFAQPASSRTDLFERVQRIGSAEAPMREEDKKKENRRDRNESGRLREGNRTYSRGNNS